MQACPGPRSGASNRIHLLAPRLDLRNLSRRFDGKLAVDDLSLTVEAGQVTCLLGPSGCGKTTTLRMVAGIEQQDSGAIYVDGQEISGASVHLPAEARGIGLMFQDFALFPHLKVAENVGYGLRGQAGAKARVSELLERVGLSRYAQSYPHVLSGGEQQRVALARALAPRPRVMLMDEPFSGLDERLRDDVRDDTLSVLREEGTAVLLVTHDPAEAMGMADEIALIRAGRVVQQGAPQELYMRPVDRDAAAFFSDINVLNGLVSAGKVQTPLGSFDVDGRADGDRVDVVIRPQLLQIGANGAVAEVKAARFKGAHWSVQLALEGGENLRVTTSASDAPKLGARVHVSVDPSDVLIF